MKGTGTGLLLGEVPVSWTCCRQNCWVCFCLLCFWPSKVLLWSQLKVLCLPGQPFLVKSLVVMHFLKGLQLTFHGKFFEMPQLDFNLVLTFLMCPPFEAINTCPLRRLTLKVVFLVAITSARQVCELEALLFQPPKATFLSGQTGVNDFNCVPTKGDDAFSCRTSHHPPNLLCSTSPSKEKLHCLNHNRALRF